VQAAPRSRTVCLCHAVEHHGKGDVGCCSGKGCDEFFTDRVAARDADRYRRKGLDGNARRVVDFVRRQGVEGRTVLEVGGGVGAIEVELLRAGAARATNVELSPAYEPYIAELMAEGGVAERSERRLLDFAERPDELEAADVVVLHKVVCCYPDFDALVTAAAAHARHQLVFTFPRDSWWTRAGIAAANLVERLRGHSFRAYVHPPEEIVTLARTHGLEPVETHRGPIWQFVGLVRGTAPPAPATP
jgi:magnesium-protoporphyrin O-methyltransferase